MEFLGEMISALDRHGAKHYKVFAGRTDCDEKRKDFMLFDHYRQKWPDCDDETLFSKLYGRESSDKNAFYRLKNRLAADISKSVFIHNISGNPQMHAHFHVALGYYYSSINKFRLSLWFFRKAESRCIETENYGLLDIIYSQLIRLAREIVNINPEDYIRKRKENRLILNRLSEVEDILEVLEYRMKITQNLGQAEPIPEIMQRTLEEYTRNEEVLQSSKVQFGIYFIVSRFMLQNRDYEGLEKYLTETYLEFCKKGLFNKSNHQNKLQMLAWTANAAFFNKRYERSLELADILKQQMEYYDRLHFDTYEMFYLNVLVINYSVLNPNRAIAILTELTAKKTMEKHGYYGIFVFLNLAILYFQQKQYEKAVLNISRLYNHPSYENLDPGVKLHINIGELMIRFEKKEFDILEYRLKQVRKEYKDFGSETAESIFLDVLSVITRKADQVQWVHVSKKLTCLKEIIKDSSGAESLLFSFGDWILKKCEKSVLTA